MNMNPLVPKIEAVLFFKTDALSVGKLARLLDSKESEVEEALSELEKNLEGRGVALSRIGDEVMLTTAPETSALVDKLAKEEREGELSKASVETLSVVLYKDGATKSEIDYIRGVNSSFILRALQIRGLVERTQNPDDSRSFRYIPTFDLYTHLGVKKKEELPDYERLVKELGELDAAYKEAEEKKNHELL